MDDLSQFFDYIKKNKKTDVGFLDANVGSDFILEFLEQYKTVKKPEKTLEEVLQEDPTNTEPCDENAVKKWLIQLSHFTEIEALKTLKSFIDNGQNTALLGWAKMCDTMLKANFKSEMLEEEQVFLFTGMGGKDNKIRMFVGLVSVDNHGFTDFQKKILQKEMVFALKQNSGELETIEFDQNVAKVVFLSPIESDFGDIIKYGVDAANEFGNFIKNNFLFTNRGALERDEILDFFLKNRSDKSKDTDSADENILE